MSRRSQEIETQQLVLSIDTETSPKQTTAQGTMTEDDDAPLYRRKLSKALGHRFIAAASRRDKYLRPLMHFIKEKDRGSIKQAYGTFFCNIKKRLMRDECLIIDDRVVIPTQLRDTVLDTVHLTHQGTDAMLHIAEDIWFPLVQRNSRIGTGLQTMQRIR